MHADKYFVLRQRFFFLLLEHHQLFYNKSCFFQHILQLSINTYEREPKKPCEIFLKIKKGRKGKKHLLFSSSPPPLASVLCNAKESNSCCAAFSSNGKSKQVLTRLTPGLHFLFLLRVFSNTLLWNFSLCLWLTDIWQCFNHTLTSCSCLRSSSRISWLRITATCCGWLLHLWQIPYWVSSSHTGQCKVVKYCEIVPLRPSSSLRAVEAVFWICLVESKR